MTLVITPADIVRRAEAGGYPGLLAVAPGWGRTPLGAVAKIVNGAPFSSRLFNTQGIGMPLVRIRDVVRGSTDTFYDGSFEEIHVVQDGDLLVGMDGDFRAAIWRGGRALLNQRVCKLTVAAPDIYDSRFLFYVLQGYLDAIWAETSAVTVKHLSSKTLAETPVPIPPLDEQRRIVTILEDHLSHLDAASASLRKTEALVQTGILAARQQAVVGGLHPLGDVAEVVGGIQKQPKRAPKSNPAPFLRVANVTSDGLDLSEVHEIELFEGELAKYRLVAGDLLVVEGNGSANQIGRAATWRGEIADCVHQNHLIRVRPGEGLDPAYLELVWNAPSTRRRLSAVASSSSGLHTLSVSKLKALMIPVPDIQAQIEHVARYVEMREQMSRAGSSVQVSLGHSIRLRRGLLQAAFSGQLTREAISV